MKKKSITESQLIAALEKLSEVTPVDRDGFHTTRELAKFFKEENGGSLDAAIRKVRTMWGVAQEEGRLERGSVMMEGYSGPKPVDAYKLKEPTK